MTAERENFASNRRGFLRQLCALPLIGGSVTLIGQPTAIATPATKALLEQYAAWCAREHAHTLIELETFSYPAEPAKRDVMIRHRREWVESLPLFGIRGDTVLGPMPSTRAAVILSAAGVPLMGGARG